jgi:hypothetical protein
MFGPAELEALVLGVEAERLWPGDVRGICLRKRLDPGFKLEAQEALCGAQPLPCAPLSLADVLARLDLRLRSATLAEPREQLDRTARAA